MDMQEIDRRLAEADARGGVKPHAQVFAELRAMIHAGISELDQGKGIEIPDTDCHLQRFRKITTQDPE